MCCYHEGPQKVEVTLSSDDSLACALVKPELRQACQDMCFSPCLTAALAQREMNGIFRGKELKALGERSDIWAEAGSSVWLR